MSNGLIAFLVALGSGAWVYSQMMRRTGSQPKPALIVATICGVFVFVIVLILTRFIPES